MRHNANIMPLLLLALALTACSQADDPDVPGTPHYSITFNTSGSVEEGTRIGNTVGLHTIGLDEVKVYGYKTLGSTLQNVMPGYTLRYVDGTANNSTSNTTGWEYVGLTDATGTSVKDYLGMEQEIKYWDGNSTSYRFFGVLSDLNDKLKYDGQPITSSTVITEDKSFSMDFKNLSYMTRTLGDDGSYKYYEKNTTTEVAEKDVPMYGTMWQGDPAANYDKPVTLAFSKPYALVRLVFVRPDGSSVTQLGDPTTGSATPYSATFYPKDGSLISDNGSVDVTWSLTGTQETTTATTTTPTLPNMTFNPIELTEAETRYQAWPEYLMVPTASDASAVDYECKVYVEEVSTTSSGTTTSTFNERTALIPKAFTHWMSGYEYTYVFKITYNNSLEFSHAILAYTKWQAGYSDATEW